MDTRNLTNKDRLLALDAACTACEFPGIPENIRAACNLLADELEQYFNDVANAFPKGIDVFLLRQKAAVSRLASHPEEYGAE